MKKSNKTLEEKNQLYEKYKNLIYGVLRDMHCNIKNVEQFKDYYSVAEYGLAKAINNISGDWKNSTSSYFYAYIKNELVNYFHYKTRPKRILSGSKMADIDDFQIDAGIDLEKEYIFQEECEELYKALDNIKPIYKNILIRRYGIGTEKKTIAEIALEDNVTHQAIQQREAYALDKIRKELLKQLNEQEGKTFKFNSKQHIKFGRN